MEKVLNQEEIDAMVRAARSGNPAGGSVTAGPVVQPWDIRQAGQVGREQLRSINQLHELFARNLTHSIGAYLRIVFDCSLVSAEHLTYREFLQRIPEKTYLASCDLAPVGVLSLLQLDLAIAFPIIDVLLGGEGKGSEAVRDITEIEEQVLESIVRIICRELQTTWEAISLEFNFGQRQQISQAQRLMVPDEKNLCLSFEIKMSETRGTLNLAVPAVVSNALLRKISADLSYQRPHSPIEARRQIEKKLLDCPFSVELSLPHLRVPLQSLAELTPGTVLPFSRNASAPAILQVEEIRLCKAAPVRVNARRAARVLALEPATPKAGEP
jgi:flagellar motor switch protein FliM